MERLERIEMLTSGWARKFCIVALRMEFWRGMKCWKGWMKTLARFSSFSHWVGSLLFPMIVNWARSLDITKKDDTLLYTHH
jgi:hypothetical protein